MNMCVQPDHPRDTVHGCVLRYNIWYAFHYASLVRWISIAGRCQYCFTTFPDCFTCSLDPAGSDLRRVRPINTEMPLALLSPPVAR